MARKKRPSWLYAAFIILLAVFSLMLWAGRNHHQKSSVASTPEASSVIYEDIQRLSSLEEHTGETQKTKQNLSPDYGIALILDDVGYNLEALKRALKLPYPMAISVIPNAPYAIRAAEMAHASGHVVMLHLPMEPSNPRYSLRMGDAFLRAGMSQDAVRRIMLDDLARIPYVSGVNNHMGSRLTELETPMRWVMNVCHERGLFFVDSRTSKDSVAAKLAREAGLLWGERRVFLDNSLKMEDLEASWQAVRRKASHHIPVIVIAHPHNATLDFLETRVRSGDANRILPLKRLLFAGSIHVENNAN